MPFNTILVALLLLAIGFRCPSYADTVKVFDGSQKTTPDAQGWLYITDPLPPPLGPGSCATQSANGDGTHLNTNCNIRHSAGYFSQVPPLSHPLMPELDRAVGFTISFEIEILSESHNNKDRAGFSIIVITHDLKGIQLAFWEDEIWAQADDPLFTHGEGGDFETTSGLMLYRLALLGEEYFLSADGLTILTGRLRDYTSFGKPYDIADFVFFGDDTSSASASIKVASVTHLDHATIVHCDVNGDGAIGLEDAILALQILAGLEPATPIGSQVDVNGDARLGLEEVSYIIQKAAQLRQ